MDSVVGVEPEGVVGAGSEGLVELVEVADDVGAELGGGVGVDGEELEGELGADLDAPDERPVVEDALLPGEAVDDRWLGAVEAELGCRQRDGQPAQVEIGRASCRERVLCVV